MGEKQERQGKPIRSVIKNAGQLLSKSRILLWLQGSHLAEVTRGNAS